MPALTAIEAFTDELVAIRRDLHAHPEIGFEEVRTSGIVAEKLAAWGIEVHRGIGGTGVVGILEGTGGPGRRIGLRAEHLHLAPAGQGVPARVELAEHLGDSSIIHLRVEGLAGLLTAKVAGNGLPLQTGALLGLAPDAAHALAFDAAGRLLK